MFYGLFVLLRRVLRLLSYIPSSFLLSKFHNVFPDGDKDSGTVYFLFSFPFHAVTLCHVSIILPLPFVFLPQDLFGSRVCASLVLSDNM